MTLAERCQLQRAEEQMQAPLLADLAEPMRFRRMRCACGCGRWWYWQRVQGRPPKYATEDCRLRARAQRAAGRAA